MFAQFIQAFLRGLVGEEETAPQPNYTRPSKNAMKKVLSSTLKSMTADERFVVLVGKETYRIVDICYQSALYTVAYEDREKYQKLICYLNGRRSKSDMLEALREALIKKAHEERHKETIADLDL